MAGWVRGLAGDLTLVEFAKFVHVHREFRAVRQHEAVVNDAVVERVEDRVGRHHVDDVLAIVEAKDTRADLGDFLVAGDVWVEHKRIPLEPRQSAICRGRDAYEMTAMIGRKIAPCHDVEFFANGEDDGVVVVHLGVVLWGA